MGAKVLAKSLAFSKLVGGNNMKNNEVVTVEIVGKFLKNLPSQFEKIRAMLCANDTFGAMDRIRIIGSMSWTFKLDMMTDCVYEIERLLELNRVEQAKEMLLDAKNMAKMMFEENGKVLEKIKV